MILTKALTSRFGGLSICFHHKLTFLSPKTKNAIEKGGKIVEGIDRGKLAIALEAIGEKEEAEKEWKVTKDLTRRQSVEETKKLVYSIHDQNNSALAKEVEKGILGETEKAQQKNRGDKE